MEILTGSQMRRVDARAIEERGIPSIELMEAAGGGVARAMLEEIPGLRERRVVVLCGRGNNGGDGLVAARHLAAAGVPVEIVLLATADALKGDAAENARRARAAGLAVREIPDEAAWKGAALDAGPADVVVDAILGTGVTGGARGLAAVVIEASGAWPATFVSIDLPSGADADSGELPGPVLRAHRTYTLCRPKLCVVLEPVASHAGPFRVIDIGIPGDAIGAERSDLSWIDAEAAAALLPPRPRGAHKGTMGHLLVAAGSRGKSGAASLVAEAALRSGVGLVTAAVPRGVQDVVAASRAEVMTEGLAETRAGTLAAPAAAVLLRLSSSCSALALGPGLGLASAAGAVVRTVLARRALPMVLDADGLNAIAGRRSPAPKHALVVTPHPGEAARLLRTTAAAIQSDRLGSARRLAALTGGIAVLKGRRSIVARPEGGAAFIASGNPGMATGGSGDALTGVIGALLARRMEPFDAAVLGTYVHGAAGDFAAARLGEEGMLAGDIIASLPEAWRALAAVRDEGRRWTRGV
ncbi:MAG TPA: NAD(P)H-hydrate dehydratase [Candidatus Polarisedimenticolaceae bacterium]|nr:NAD(P)H-hydrate dehydratase [Candidatus Polarisedimenticolaceae bacterium]